MSYPVMDSMKDVTKHINKQPVTSICSLWPKDGNRGKWWMHLFNTLMPFIRLGEKQSWQYLALAGDEVHYLSIDENGGLFDAETYRLNEVTDVVVSRQENRQQLQFRHGEHSYDYICCEFPFGQSGFSEQEYAQFKAMSRKITGAFTAARLKSTPVAA